MSDSESSRHSEGEAGLELEELGGLGLLSPGEDGDVVLGLGGEGRNVEAEVGGPGGVGGHVGIELGVLVEDLGTEHVAGELHAVEVGGDEPETGNVELLGNTGGDGEGSTLGGVGIHDEVLLAGNLGDDETVVGDLLVDEGVDLGLDGLHALLEVEGGSGGEKDGGEFHAFRF